MLARSYVETYPENAENQNGQYRQGKKLVKRKVVRKRKVKPKNNIKSNATIKQKTTPKVKKEVSAKIAIRVFTLSAVFIMMLLFIVSLIGHSSITKTRMEVNKLETYKEDLKKTKIDLTAELEGIKSSSRIGDDAMYILGMVYPEDDQVVHLNISDEIDMTVAKGQGDILGIGKLYSYISGLF